MHPRTTIRNAVVGLLNTRLAASGVQAHGSRFRAWNADELPAVAVYALSETSQIHDEAPRSYLRSLELGVEVIPEHKPGSADALADAMDDLAEQVEAAVMADPELGGLVNDVRLVGTDMVFEPKGEHLVAAARLRFTVEYVTAAPVADPEGMDDFKTAHIEWTPKPGAEDTEPAVDNVTLPTE